MLNDIIMGPLTSKQLNYLTQY